MQPNKLSRREREKRRQRQDMLAAALVLFSEKGYHNVSMQEIAIKAEFAVGTLYKFFNNKEDLYKAMVVEKTERFHGAMTKALDEIDDEIEKLRNYVKTKTRMFIEDASFIRLYFAETRGASFNIKAGLDCDIQEKRKLLLCALASVFENGIKKQVFKKIAEPYQLALAFDSLCSTFLFNWLQSSDQEPFPEDPDVILNILFKGLIST